MTTLPKRDASFSLTGCCPVFNPEGWDEQKWEFRDKLFMKITSRSVLHMPINLGTVMKRSMAQIEAAGAANDEYLMLSEEVSSWQAVHYIAVAKEVPGAEMVRLSGTYLTKVFEGPYKEMRHWYTELMDYAKAQGAKPIKIYFSYTMCPRCAKVYGSNYVIGFAQVA